MSTTENTPRTSNERLFNLMSDDDESSQGQYSRIHGPSHTFEDEGWGARDARPLLPKAAFFMGDLRDGLPMVCMCVFVCTWDVVPVRNTRVPSASVFTDDFVHQKNCKQTDPLTPPFP